MKGLKQSIFQGNIGVCSGSYHKTLRNGTHFLVLAEYSTGSISHSTVLHGADIRKRVKLLRWFLLWTKSIYGSALKQDLSVL